MPDFKLRAPDDSNWPGEDFIVSDLGERARLLATGYTDVTDEKTEDSGEQPVDQNSGAQAGQVPEKRAAARPAPKPAPGTETRQPDAS